MRYVVFTTKHHDGFCMFDTKQTDYKITDPACPFSGNPRANVTKEIFEAFRKQGFMIGAYFSKPDWHNENYWWPNFATPDRNVNYDIPKYPDRWKKFVDFTHNQILELMTDYGRIDILWLDGGWVRIKTDDEIREAILHAKYATRPQSQDINMPELVAQGAGEAARPDRRRPRRGRPVSKLPDPGKSDSRETSPLPLGILHDHGGRMELLVQRQV